MLKVSKIDVYYGDAQALYDVTLAVDRGEIVSIVGSNGAGKTTLLKTISGLLHPASGNIEFLGERIDKLPPFKIVEMGVTHVPEGRGLFPYMTVLEHLELGAYARRAKGKLEESLKNVYEIFPILEERQNQLAGTLSGGEQQMLAIARALMSRPGLLMLDEPSLGLAPKLVLKIFEIIKSINEQGVAVLLVEQNTRYALTLASRGYVLENGKIILEGMGSHLLQNDLVRKAYMGL